MPAPQVPSLEMIDAEAGLVERFREQKHPLFPLGATALKRQAVGHSVSSCCPPLAYVGSFSRALVLHASQW